jgi:hypothetical protein
LSHAGKINFILLFPAGANVMLQVQDIMLLPVNITKHVVPNLLVEQMSLTVSCYGTSKNATAASRFFEKDHRSMAVITKQVLRKPAHRSLPADVAKMISTSVIVIVTIQKQAI